MSDWIGNPVEFDEPENGWDPVHVAMESRIMDLEEALLTMRDGARVACGRLRGVVIADIEAERDRAEAELDEQRARLADILGRERSAGWGEIATAVNRLTRDIEQQERIAEVLGMVDTSDCGRTRVASWGEVAQHIKAMRRDYEAAIEFKAELAARREVDEWLRTHVDTMLMIDDEACGVAWRTSPEAEYPESHAVKTAPDYPALAAKLREVGR
jgi:hypothetical protein